MYGEKIDIYSGTDPDMKEFAEAGLDYINMAGMIASALPLYRIFPTKAYRDYAKCVRRLQNAGECKVVIMHGSIPFLSLSNFRTEDSQSEVQAN